MKKIDSEKITEQASGARQFMLFNESLDFVNSLISNFLQSNDDACYKVFCDQWLDSEPFFTAIVEFQNSENRYFIMNPTNTKFLRFEDRFSLIESLCRNDRCIVEFRYLGDFDKFNIF